MAAEKKLLSRRFWQHAETKISAGVSRITRPAELNEMVQYSSSLSSVRYSSSLSTCLHPVALFPRPGGGSRSSSTSRSSPKGHIGLMNWTGPGPNLPGPQSWSFRFTTERPEMTAVQGPVRTGLGLKRDGHHVIHNFSKL
jgi:hypothetical protein